MSKRSGIPQITLHVWRLGWTVLLAGLLGACGSEDSGGERSKTPVATSVRTATLTIEATVDQLRKRIMVLEDSTEWLAEWRSGTDAALDEVLGTKSSMVAELQQLSVALESLDEELTALDSRLAELEESGVQSRTIQVYDAGGNLMGQMMDIIVQGSCTAYGESLDRCNKYVVFNKALGKKIAIQDYWGGLSGETYYTEYDCKGTLYLEPGRPTSFAYESGTIHVSDPLATPIKKLLVKSYRKDGGGCKNQTFTSSNILSPAIALDDPPFAVPLQTPFSLR